MAAAHLRSSASATRIQHNNNESATMLMNYHELTMNEARDSPGRRQQFLVICIVIAAAFFYSVTTAGGFSSVQFEEGFFPGGEFVYKTTGRDYAASLGFSERVRKEANITKRGSVDVIYSLYLDDPNLISGRKMRFASGLMVTKPEHKDAKKKLLAKNRGLVPPSAFEVEDLPARKLFERLSYQTATLPRVPAVVVHFPYTDGFVSALVLSLKIIPALRAKVKSSSDTVTVLTTCSSQEMMCTHYGLTHKSFLLGMPGLQAHLAEVGKAPFLGIHWSGISKMLEDYVPLYAVVFGKSSTSDEL